MELNFEELKEQDLPEVKKIYDWYIENSIATFHTEPIRTDQLKEFIYIDHPLYNSYLIRMDKEIAGYCYLTNYKKRQAYDRTAEITIYLKPEFCNQGIGKAALHYLESKAKENGLKNLIGVITGDNEGSIALFERSGLPNAHILKMLEKNLRKCLMWWLFRRRYEFLQSNNVGRQYIENN